MKYLSVCSGIEAASVAWAPLGWNAVAYSEIEKFPSAVLAHHYPGTPNWGDMTKFQEWPDADVDVLVGGTPCQSFSVAGLRQGLADPRGNLAFVYLAIAERYSPRWLVFENVPGLRSQDGGRAFGAFLGALGELGYGWAYRSFDAQYAGLAQRRERVFVVGRLGDRSSAAAVLFERESLSGDTPACVAARQDAAARSAATPRGGRLWRQIAHAFGFGEQVGVSPANALNGVSHALSARHSATGRYDPNGETFIAQTAPSLTGNPYGDHESREGLLVAHALRGEGSDASEDGTGRGTPLVPVVANSLGANAGRNQIEQAYVPFDTTQITSQGNYSRPKPGDPCYPLASGAHPPAVAFSCKDYGADAGDLAPTLRAMGHDGSHANAGDQVAVAHSVCLGSDPIWNRDLAMPQTTRNGDPGVVACGYAIRRLTPRECERLQGFKDDYTRIPWRGKPADHCPDGPRYKALGNSMAVPVMRWLGERIEMVQTLIQEQANDAGA